MAVIRRCGDIPVRRGGGGRGGAAKLAAVRNRRTRHIDVGGDGNPGCRDGAASPRAQRRRSAEPDPDRHGREYGCNRCAALRARLHPRRTRHTLRALSGDRRVSGRNGMADGAGRHPGGDRPQADLRDDRYVRQLRAAGQACRRVCSCAGPATDPAAMAQPLRASGHPACRYPCDARISSAERRLGRRGTGRWLDLSGAGSGFAHALPWQAEAIQSFPGRTCR